MANPPFRSSAFHSWPHNTRTGYDSKLKQSGHFFKQRTKIPARRPIPSPLLLMMIFLLTLNLLQSENAPAPNIDDALSDFLKKGTQQWTRSNKTAMHLKTWTK
ncbi:unnamed protein product [Absidia cylindrospora]